MKRTITPLLLFTFVLLVIACNEKSIHEHLGTSILDTISNDKILSGGTRAKMKEQEKEIVSKFTVVHNGNLAEMTTNPESTLKALMETHNLQVQNPFDIDEENKGFVLVSTSKIANPVALGKEISLIEEVLMVEIGGVPANYSSEQAS